MKALIFTMFAGAILFSVNNYAFDTKDELREGVRKAVVEYLRESNHKDLDPNISANLFAVITPLLLKLKKGQKNYVEVLIWNPKENEGRTLKLTVEYDSGNAEVFADHNTGQWQEQEQWQKLGWAETDYPPGKTIVDLRSIVKEKELSRRNNGTFLRLDGSKYVDCLSLLSFKN